MKVHMPLKQWMLLKKYGMIHRRFWQIVTLKGDLHFAGETATKVDDRSVNNRDLVVIVLLETLLIFVLLIALTKSFKMPIYMMGTILLSFLAALGLGMFLSSLFFDISTSVTVFPCTPLFS